MQSDKRTLKDLSFMGNDAHGTVLNLIDRCNTFAGRAMLIRQIYNSPKSFELLCEQQEVIKYWARNTSHWSDTITNGTLVMLEKFYESADNYSSHPGGIGIFSGKVFQKIFNRNEYFFTQFSLSHLSDFLTGCKNFTTLLHYPTALPNKLKTVFEEMEIALDHRLVPELIAINKETSFRDLARLSFHARREMKANVQKLTDCYAQLDTWHSLAQATLEHHWHFPELLPQDKICFDAKELYHPLLTQAVNYDLNFSAGKSFMILTGANMSGKTTMMRAMGISALLAHLGMGVPATSMRISFLQGLITNMHVEDDLIKGESFFFAEVKSIKHTAEAIASDEPHLVLMDELFKGTNVHDAYECTKAIVEGLLLHPNHIMVLSTHLHEVAHHFEHHTGLSFYCFTTSLGHDGNYEFSYQLKPGISDDRIGYKILVKEGIVAILNNTNKKSSE
jgi:DNA mismatch repair protein MutS